MISPVIKDNIIALYKRGCSLRDIAQTVNIAINTIRKVLKEAYNGQAENNDLSPCIDEKEIALIKTLIVRCRGNVIRVHELLREEYDKKISYSTLTLLVRKYQLRDDKKPERCGEYDFQPGAEMPFDTSPHRVDFINKSVQAQCASLVFAYSRRVYIQYYPCFTRFEAKIFLTQAFQFMEGCCRRCVIDNTSVVLGGGAGANAVISPEMLMFSRAYGFSFFAHAIMHSDRKARVERPFHFADKNFLAGRQFNDWNDLNQKALQWCCEVSNQKPKRTLGERKPEDVYQEEKRYLLPLPSALPPVYQYGVRTVDKQAYINIDTNRYSVPERFIDQFVDVYKYADTIKVFYKNRLITEHPRFIGVRYQQSLDEKHHSIKRFQEKQTPMEEELLLRGYSKELDLYIVRLKKHVRGRGMQQFRHLLNLQRAYPKEAFVMAIKKALEYGLYDLTRLEALIIQHTADEFFNMQ